MEPPIRLSNSETVTDIPKFVVSTVCQLQARMRGEDWLAGNYSIETILARLAAVGCFMELEEDPEGGQKTG